MTKPNSGLTVNRTTTPGGKTLAMYEFPDREEPEDGCEPGTLLSEAVTITAGNGEELIGLKRPEQSLPVVVADQPERLHNGEQFAIGQTAVRVLHENRRRRTALVQNLGVWRDADDGPQALPRRDRDLHRAGRLPRRSLGDRRGRN